MFILKKGHQPGVYVPLRALFLVIFRFGFEGWIGVLIASVPDICMLFTFVIVLIVIVLLTGSKQDESCNYL